MKNKRESKFKKTRQVLAVFLTVGIVLTTLPALAMEIQASQDFEVGRGVTWPTQVNAPFVDMTGYYSKEGYQNGGAPDLARFYKDTGVKYYNLGFIQSTGEIKNNQVVWGWGGYGILNESQKNNDQYKGIKKSIKDLRNLGGDVAISFGGFTGTPFWQLTQDVDLLYNTYVDIVDGYNLTRIDLDVEGGAQNKQNNIANAKAIKKLQDKTGVDVSLTLPVLPSGLINEGLGVLEAYLSQGVDLVNINIMTMCYGSGTLKAGENYGTASLRAVESLKNQLKDYYKTFASTTLTDQEAYAKIGTTVSIGFEGQAHPIFTPEWCKLVVDHATEKGIGMTSFWSMNRDAKLDDNTGVNTQYEFTDIFKGFGEGAKKPGPDVPKPDIIKPDEPAVPVSTWISEQVYDSGDIVVWDGLTWEAGWWTQGDQPGTTGEWGAWTEIEGAQNQNQSQNQFILDASSSIWKLGKAYKGVTWKAGVKSE